MLEQVTPHSFHADHQTIAALTRRVLTAGWQSVPVRSQWETARFVSPQGAILIFYTTGSINVQGQDTRRVVAALRRFGGLDQVAL